MKKLLCVMFSVLMLCSFITYNGSSFLSTISAAPVNDEFTNDGRELIFGKETVEVKPLYYGQNICRELKVTSPIVLTYKPVLKDVNNTRLIIGTNIIDYNKVGQDVSEDPKKIGDKLYDLGVNESNQEVQVYLGKGTYYIMIKAFASVPTDFTFEFTKDSPSNYELETLKYTLNLNEGKWLKEKSISKTIKMIRGGVKPYIMKNYERESPVKTGYRFNGFTLKRESDGKWMYKSSGSQQPTVKWITSGKNASDSTKYKFNCLHLSSSLNEEVYNLVDFNDTYKFYTQWKANKFTIKYHANGGTGKMSNSYATFGERNVTKANTFKRSGYSFAGWYVKRESDGKWLYTNGTTKKWFENGKQLKGYKKAVYKNEATLSKTTSIHNDKVHLYAKWNQK